MEATNEELMREIHEVRGLCVLMLLLECEREVAGRPDEAEARKRFHEKTKTFLRKWADHKGKAPDEATKNQEELDEDAFPSNVFPFSIQ